MADTPVGAAPTPTTGDEAAATIIAELTPTDPGIRKRVFSTLLRQIAAEAAKR